MRILVVEDEVDLNNVIVKKLSAENYSVDSCLNGADALLYLDGAEYDAVILDIMMPQMNGYEVLKKMRQNEDRTPVLLLTAKDTIEDRVTGLDLGADDYLIKPFAFDELLARIRVIQRRSGNHASNIISIADLQIDINSRTVKRDDTIISLSTREFSILEYMIRNQNIVLARDKIEQHIWNYDYCGGSNIVDVYIRYLRKKVDDPFEKKLIHTIRGIGYVLRES